MYRSSVFDIAWQQPNVASREPVIRARRQRSVIDGEQRQLVPVFPTKARERLGALEEADLRYFNPRVFPNKNREETVAAILRQFCSGLKELFSSHAGGLFLAVHENDVTGHGKQKVIRTDIYYGRIADDVKNILSVSGKVVFPTTQYVISQACTEACERREGRLEETVFGERINAIWLFNLLVPNGGHALDFFFGKAEVEQWFKQRWDGIRPFLYEHITDRLDAPLFKENLSFDFA